MKHLESSIALRIMDCFGIFTKNMPDIRSDFFKIKDVWALCATTNKEDLFVFLYTQKGDKKYLVSSFGADNKAKLWLCLVIGDETEENPELNRMFILRIGENDKWLVREAEVIETANLLITFECFRQFFNGWTQYKPTNDELVIMDKFMSSITEEDIEE